MTLAGWGRETSSYTEYLGGRKYSTAGRKNNVNMNLRPSDGTLAEKDGQLCQSFLWQVGMWLWLARDLQGRRQQPKACKEIRLLDGRREKKSLENGIRGLNFAAITN